MYKLGWFGAVRGHSNKVIGNVSVRQNANNFLFNFNSYYASILYRFQDIASHCRKSPIFTFPTYIWRPVGGDSNQISPKSLATVNYIESLGFRAALFT